MAKNKPYRYPVYLTARLVAGLLAVLPRPLLLKMARGLGRAGFALIARHRKKTLRHLRMAFGRTRPEPEIQAIACDVFENLAQTAADALCFSRMKPEDRSRLVDVRQAGKVYKEILAEGHGLIAVTSHLGNWELLGAAILGMTGFPGKAVARRQRYEPFNRWIESLRRSCGVETIYRGDSSREVYRVLRRGEVLGLLPDQDIDSLRGVFVDFFGRPAYTSTAPVRLSLNTGAPVVTTFLVREAGSRYKAIIGDVIRPQIRTTREAALQEYTEAWMKSCERVIRQYPGQWGWMHNRWKTRPEAVRSGRQT